MPLILGYPEHLCSFVNLSACQPTLYKPKNVPEGMERSNINTRSHGSESVLLSKRLTLFLRHCSNIIHCRIAHFSWTERVSQYELTPSFLHRIQGYQRLRIGLPCVDIQQLKKFSHYATWIVPKYTTTIFVRGLKKNLKRKTKTNDYNASYYLLT